MYLNVNFIMAVPKRKQSPSRTGMRRSQNMKFKSTNIVEDKKSVNTDYLITLILKLECIEADKF